MEPGCRIPNVRGAVKTRSLILSSLVYLHGRQKAEESNDQVSGCVQPTGPSQAVGTCSGGPCKEFARQNM